MYYKILRDDLKHYGMQYQEGLNVNCEETIMNSELINIEHYKKVTYDHKNECILIAVD